MKILILALTAAFLDVFPQSGIAGHVVLVLATIALLARSLAMPLPE